MGVHIFGVIATLCLASYTDAVSNPDIPLTTPQLIQKYGYPVESHTVTTADGYILTMHRIPGSTKSPVAPNKPVVFLQHGLFSTSADWIILGPEKSLGYLLADAGYDVWLGNARGNSYSQEHTSLSTSSYEYWSFSWHEMGIYDLPAEFEYVLALTGQTDMFYVGHSMGTTMFYVLMSSMPEYNAKVRYMISLAPIAFMSHTTSTLAKFGSYLPGGQIGLEFLEFLGLGKLTPTNSLMDFLSDNACSENSFTQPVCSNIMFMLVGYDPDELNTTTLPVILSHTPDVASTKTVLHYAQLISSLEQRDAQTLINIIQQWILPGTTIISDCWAAYNTLNDQGFTHLKVNHKVEFVSTAKSGEVHVENLRRLAGQNTKVHTQNIRRKWLSLKYSVPVFGRRKENFEGYLAEHIFKANFQRTQRIHHFLVEAGKLYPPP